MHKQTVSQQEETPSIDSINRASFSSLFKLAIQHHEAGRWQEAEIGYAHLQTIVPDNFELLHRRGVLNAQLGRFDTALELLKQAVLLNPQDSFACSNLGNVYKSIGDQSAALTCYQKAVELAPENASVWSNLGICLHELGEQAEAETCLIKSLELDPNQADAWSNLGNVYCEYKKDEEANQCYQNALIVNEGHVNALINLALNLKKQNEFQQAEIYLNRLLAIQADHEVALFLLAEIFMATDRVEQAQALLEKARNIAPNKINACIRLAKHHWDRGQLAESEQYIRQALQLAPENVDALSNLGALLKEQGKLKESEASLRKALSINPLHVDALSNLANTLTDNYVLDEAQQLFEQAIRLNPEHANSWANLGCVHLQIGELQQAETCFRKSIEFDPELADAHASLGMVLLLKGNFYEGWSEYEWRWKKWELINKQRHFQQPVWQGEDLNDKSLYIYTEQGYGDLMQFIRYVIPLSEQAGKLYLEVSAKLRRLIADFEKYVEFVTEDNVPDTFDYQTSLLSLPYQFKTELESIPNHTPYLAAEKERVEFWQKELISGSRLKVGLAWKGNSKNKMDHLRSISLEYFQPLFELDGVQFISLQKGDGEEQISEFGFDDQLDSFTAEMDNGADAFVDTAAVIENLDAVITCDTAIAHLAGAMGKPVYLLLTYLPDFRWLLNREDSPWYPSIRLVRQEQPGDWQGVITKLGTLLSEL